VAQPVVTAQPVPAVAAIPTLGASTADAKAATDSDGAASAVGGTPGSAPPSAAAAADLSAKGAADLGARGAADLGAKGAADLGNAGEIKGQPGRKGASTTNGAANAQTADASTAETADGGDNAAPADKSETAHVHSTPQAGDKAAPKADTAPVQQVDAQAAGDQSAANAGQITQPQPHSTDHNVAPAAANQAGAAANNPITVPIAGLAVGIAAQAQAGSNRFEIRLDPPELGRIEVRLDVDRDGNVKSRLVVEKSETLDLLRRDAPQLERALQQAGLKTGDSGLQFTLRDQSFAQGQGNGDQGSSAARIVVPDVETPTVDAVQAGYGRSLRLGGGIDIRV
jgi:flagellar hook-length control protein FliK